MTFVSSDNFHQKSFRIKHDDGGKLFNKILSKESHPSFRVYYGDVSGAVPFTWETRPGTPKHSFSENPNIPPLTPPPSYFTPSNSRNYYSSKSQSRSKLLFRTLLGRSMNINSEKYRLGSSPKSSSSLSSLSWSDSMMTPPSAGRRRRRTLSNWDLYFEDIHDQEKCTPTTPSNSKFYFWGGKEDKLSPMGFSVFFVKKALLSIVGRGSS